MKKSVNKVMTVNKLTKSKEKTEEEKLNIEKEKEKIRQERLAFIQKAREERKPDKKKINIRAPKYANIRKLSTTEKLIKQLTKASIISSIFKDILSFISDKFHWLCYFIMILDHIMSYSLISLFYPISIFCFAIMEYPRPKKSYWSLCFIYTIISLLLKFIIQLDIWELIPDYDEKFQFFENYRIGLKLCESTFSKDFVIYILFDALVLIFLLINNYLLVFAGLFDKREQEVESIYQANERISRTKDLKFKNTYDIELLNDEYLANDKFEYDINKEREIKEVKIKEEKKIGGLFELITEQKKEEDKKEEINVEAEKKDIKKKKAFSKE
jgi:hypothetical protein